MIIYFAEQSPGMYYFRRSSITRQLTTMVIQKAPGSQIQKVVHPMHRFCQTQKARRLSRPSTEVGRYSGCALLGKFRYERTRLDLLFPSISKKVQYPCPIDKDPHEHLCKQHNLCAKTSREALRS